MTSAIEVLELIAVVAAGLLVRLGLFLMVLLALALPLLLVAIAWDALTRPRVSPAGELAWREDAFYAPGHTWLAPARQGLLFGIDDLARRLLRHATRVSLPPVGTVVRAGEAAVVLTAGGERVALSVPVGGTVTAVNHDVLSDPSLAGRDPYGHGWLLRLRPSEGTPPALPHGAGGREWLVAEGQRFARALEAELGVAAADGGAYHVPPHLALQPEQWRRLAGAFLSPA